MNKLVEKKGSMDYTPIYISLITLILSVFLVIHHLKQISIIKIAGALAGGTVALMLSILCIVYVGDAFRRRRDVAHYKKNKSEYKVIDLLINSDKEALSRAASKEYNYDDIYISYSEYKEEDFIDFMSMLIDSVKSNDYKKENEDSMIVTNIYWGCTFADLKTGSQINLDIDDILKILNASVDNNYLKYKSKEQILVDIFIDLFFEDAFRY